MEIPFPKSSTQKILPYKNTERQKKKKKIQKGTYLYYFILWPPHAKTWLIGKDSDAGRDWGQEEKGMTEDEMAGWHHRLDGREFE